MTFNDFLNFFRTWGVAFTTLISGLALLLGSFYYWTKGAKDNRKEENETEDRIKNLWRERFELQDTKISNLGDQQIESRKEIIYLKGHQKTIEDDNDRLVKIFQGRDLDAIKYRDEGRQAMQVISENARRSDRILEHMEKNDHKFNSMLEEMKKIYEIIAKNYKESKDSGEEYTGATVESVISSKGAINDNRE